MVKKQADPKTNTSLIDRVQKLDRRLVIIVILLVIGGLFLVIKPGTSVDNEKIAREKADAYMNSVKNCDYDSYAVARYGAEDEIYKDPKLNAEDREKFDKDCHSLKSYTFIEIGKSTLIKDDSIDSYLVKYKLETDQQNNGEEHRLMVSKVDEAWIISPIPY